MNFKKNNRLAIFAIAAGIGGAGYNFMNGNPDRAAASALGGAAVAAVAVARRRGRENEELQLELADAELSLKQERNSSDVLAGRTAELRGELARARGKIVEMGDQQKILYTEVARTDEINGILREQNLGLSEAYASAQMLNEAEEVSGVTRLPMPSTPDKFDLN